MKIEIDIDEKYTDKSVVIKAPRLTQDIEKMIAMMRMMDMQISAEKNGETYLHLHINLCREDMSVIGGHLNECRISATCEMIVRKIEGTVERRLDEEVTGLNLFEFM